jgi:transposase-like protein
MWSNPPSSSIVQDRLRKFIPPYCPSPGCKFHNPDRQELGNFRLHDSRPILRFPYLVIRYRCKNCRATFSSSFFSLSFRDKKNDIYEKIEELRYRGVPKSGIAEVLKIDEDTVRRKLKKMARWTLLKLAKDQESMRIKEPVAFDGLENFSFSQYDPNNLNHAVGKESYYIYDFNLSPMNRKGLMSHRQKVRSRILEEKYGKYPASAIEDGARKIFERLLQKSEGTLELHSDNHFSYRSALSKIIGNERIAHFITPGKTARNFRNRLFPINHTDMLTRHHLADYKRETISFAKTTQAMMESFILFAGRKNYRRPRFLNPHQRDPRAHLESPAMKLGLEKKIVSFNEFYSQRISRYHVRLNEDWESLFRGLDPTSRRPIRAYRGI